MTYWMSIVRFVPDPGRGEFINIGAIAGSDAQDDWEVRTVSNWKRAKHFDERGALSAVVDFVANFQSRVEVAQESLSFAEDGISVEDLRKMSDEMCNVVQLSAPVPILAPTASAAVDLAFRELIVDPERLRFPYAKKHGAMKAVKAAYLANGIDAFRDGTLHTGPYQTRFDFAVGNGRALQLVRCWSFQLPDQNALAEEVKAWAWGVRALRLAGHGDAVIDKTGDMLAVDSGIDVEAVFLPPANDQTDRRAFDAAMDAFSDRETNIVPHPADNAAIVALNAKRLLAAVP